MQVLPCLKARMSNRDISLMLAKIKPYLRRTILKSYVLSISTYIFLDILTGFRYRHGNYLTKSGAAHADRDLSEDLHPFLNITRSLLIQENSPWATWNQ